MGEVEKELQRDVESGREVQGKEGEREGREKKGRCRERL